MYRASRARLRSVHSVSHALDGFLLLVPCALVSSRCRVQGSRFRGLFLRPILTTSSVASTLTPLAAFAYRLPGASEPRVDLRVFVPIGIRGATRVPSCVFNSCGLLSGDLGSAVALPPLAIFTGGTQVLHRLIHSVSIDLRPAPLSPEALPVQAS